MKNTIIIASSIIALLIISLTSIHVMSEVDTAIEQLQQTKPLAEKYAGGAYLGWDMPCNYTHGSSAENEQKYMECANGLVYEKIGISNSVTYFDPNDIETNTKYCPNGDVATFSYMDAYTGANADKFVDCMNW